MSKHSHCPRPQLSFMLVTTKQQSSSLYIIYLNLSYSSVYNCICSFSASGVSSSSSSSFALQALHQMFQARYYCLSVITLICFLPEVLPAATPPPPYTSVLNPVTSLLCNFLFTCLYALNGKVHLVFILYF